MTRHNNSVDYRNNHNAIAPSLIENSAINDLIYKINSVHWPDQIFVLSNRKDSLRNLSMESFLEIIDVLYHNHHAFTENRMIPKLAKNLNKESILLLLQTIQDVYSMTITWEKDKNSLFEQKRDAIKNKLKELYENNFIHNRLLLWLFLVLNHESKTNLTAEELKRYHQPQFWQNINNWLFLDEHKNQFWEEISSTKSQQNTEKTQETIADTITKNNIYKN